MRRQVSGECLDRSLGLHLLGEREPSVDQDHHHDRHRDRDDPCRPRQARGHPQQQGQGMHELPPQLPRPAPAPPPHQHIRTKLHQTAVRLARGQPGQRAPQITQQQINALRRIDRAGPLRAAGRAHHLPVTRVIRARAHRGTTRASRRPATRARNPNGAIVTAQSALLRTSRSARVRRPRRRRDEPTMIAAACSPAAAASRPRSTERAGTAQDFHCQRPRRSASARAAVVRACLPLCVLTTGRHT